MGYTIKELIDGFNNTNITDDDFIEMYDHADNLAAKLSDEYTQMIDDTLPENYVCEFNDNDKYPIPDDDTEYMQRRLDIVEPYYRNYIHVGTIYFNLDLKPVFVYKSTRPEFEAEHQKKVLETYTNGEFSRRFIDGDNNFKDYLILEDLLIKNYSKYMNVLEKFHNENTY
jgi:hypothetical protein